MRLTAAITQENDLSQCLEIDVASQGETVEHALANLREALELNFEDHEPPTSVQSPIIAPIDVNIAAA
jgi:predicted RNase H-like HicB family nuclease